MSKFREAFDDILKNNLVSDNTNYADELANWREEEEEERNNLYTHGPMSSKLYDYLYGRRTAPKKLEIVHKHKSAISKDDRELKKYKDKLFDIKYDLEHNDDPSDINRAASELAKVRDQIRQKATLNKKLQSLIGEQTLEEGGKKVFDKDTGYNVSEDENFYYDWIKKKWPDVERSKTFDDFRNPENHRPWQVDFYVPSENMMIQINKNWRHGRRPYNPEDPDCQADVEWLKSQEGDYYDKVLYTWTQLEPLKRKIAKELGYKYVEIFNMDEFIDWYKNPELTYEEYKHPTRIEYDSDEYFAQKARHRDIYGNDSKWDE